jgi:hypothetical protein
MKRIAGAVAAACLAGALLTGCGGGDDNSAGSADSTDTSTTTGDVTPPTTTVTTTTTTDDNGDGDGASGDYCNDLKSAKVTVEALGDQTMTQATFDKMTGLLHGIADEAPDSVSDDWHAISDELDAINQAFRAAGVNFDDLAKIGQPGGPTLDPAALQKLSNAMKGLDDQRLTQASTSINNEVKADCGFNLGMGG